VLEVLCTTHAGAELLATLGDCKSMQAMQRDESKHIELYEQVFDAMKQIRVEKAQSRDPQDKKKIMNNIKNGPSFLKTNLCVAGVLTTATQTELQTVYVERKTINMVQEPNIDDDDTLATSQQPLLHQVPFRSMGSPRMAW